MESSIERYGLKKEAIEKKDLENKKDREREWGEIEREGEIR